MTVTEHAAIPEQGTKPTDPVTLAFFYSPRSGKSRRTEGFLAQVLQHRRNHNTFQLLRVDVDKRPDLAERFRVTETPTLLVVADNRIRARRSEPTGCRQITELLSPWLK
jgi:thioredoxin-like negative regulator of GroEL